MKYSRKMFLFLLVLVFVAMGVSSGLYYKVRIQAKEMETQKEMQGRAEQISYQMESALDQMKFAASFILSGEDVLDSMGVLSKVGEENSNNFQVASSIKTIFSNLGAWYITKNFNNVVVFNKKGIAITYSKKLNEELALEIIEKGEYVEKAKLSYDGYYFWEPHIESWRDGKEEVVSIIKEVKGYNGTYMEIEYSVEKLNLPSDIAYCILDANKRILYKEGIDEQFAQQVLEKHIGEKKREHKTKDYLVSGIKSDNSGYEIIVFETMKNLRMEMWKDMFPSIALMFCGFLALLLYAYYSSRYLTKPVTELKHIIEKKELENMDEPLEFHSNIVEVEALGNSFKKLMERLNVSMKMEEEAVKLQMQSQFDALQAGVNPHFIFNVLNVVANRGMLFGDDEIGRICSKLAAILRYSTNTKERLACIAEEEKYLENYFYLIKARYQENFEYECFIPAEMEMFKIPKLGLQQIAENCIAHGFKNKDTLMRICITGWQEKNKYVLKVQDNGCGFSPEILEKLKRDMEQAKKEMGKTAKGYELGGMGIVNTYLRFCYMFGDQVDFQIENNETGALVTIAITLEGDEVYV